MVLPWLPLRVRRRFVSERAAPPILVVSIEIQKEFQIPASMTRQVLKAGAGAEAADSRVGIRCLFRRRMLSKTDNDVYMPNKQHVAVLSDPMDHGAKSGA